MENPFVFGKAVTGKDFIDRERELEELRSSLLSGQNVLLFSPRKMGKTSLILELFRRMKGVTCIYIDMWRITSIHALSRELVNSVIRSTYRSVERILAEIGDILKTVRPRLSIDADGRVSVDLERSESDISIAEALDFPERIATRKKRRMIVAFDEFQEIESLGGIKLEKLMRSIIQHHKKVSYIFAGSRYSLIKTIFGRKDRPFYMFAKQIKLKPIDRDVLIDFIIRRFEETGKRISRSTAEWIVDLCRGIPHNIQHLCHELWYETREDADLDLAKDVLYRKVIPSLDDGFQMIWNRIGSREQRKLLIALANETNPKVYSKEFIERYDLKTPSHVEKALKTLEESGLVEGNNIQDPFFEEWIRTRFVV